MAVALSLYSRPKIVPVCIRALMDRLEGRISQEELERRMGELEDKQLRLFTAETRRRREELPLTQTGKEMLQQG